MDTPSTAVPSEPTDGSPSPGSPASSSHLRQIWPALFRKGGYPQLPAWARGERASVITTAACTSVGVSLLTLWIGAPLLVPGAANGDVVSAATMSEAEASSPDVGAPEANGDGDSPEWVEEGVWTEAAEWIDIDADPGASADRTDSNAGTVSRQVSGPRESPLVVTSQPSGARVTVNGVGWGTTPVTIRNLPPGAKRIRVTKAGFRSEERVVDTGGATLRVTLRQAAQSRSEQ